MQGSLLVAEVMAAQGYRVQPPPRVVRGDIIQVESYGGLLGNTDNHHTGNQSVDLSAHMQAVELGDRERLLAFCRAVQKQCPVGAYIQPVAGATAGYESEVGGGGSHPIYCLCAQ